MKYVMLVVVAAVALGACRREVPYDPRVIYEPMEEDRYLK